MTRFTPVLCVLALILGTAVLTMTPATAQSQSETAQTEESQADTATTETGDAAATPTVVEMVMGDENAPVEIIEYASYTCVHCATFHNDVFKKLKAEYIDTGKVKFIYREVYFDRFGLWASMIARCAGPDRFFGMNDLIYSTQSEWTRAGEPAAIVEELRKMGRLAGLDDETLDACMQDRPKAEALIAWYQANVEEHDITGTPSFIVNGKKVSNMRWSEFKEVIEGELGS